MSGVRIYNARDEAGLSPMAELPVVLSEAKDLTPAPDSVFAALVWSFREVLRFAQDDSGLFSHDGKYSYAMALPEGDAWGEAK
jgi:hypothetical protein